MSIIHNILSGVGIFWEAEKTKINANFNALNADKAERSELPTKTSDLTNDSNFVVDANYVHTDNNFTSADKAAIASNSVKRSFPLADENRLANTSGTNTGDQDLSPYATNASVQAALNNKVDKDGSKVLSELSFTSADKALVDSIPDKQSKQVGYGLSQNNYSDGDKDKVDNLPPNTNNVLATKADLVSGVVPLNQLPEEAKKAGAIQYNSLASFPGTGDTEFLYLAKDSGILYRWNGTHYIAVSKLNLATMTEINAPIVDDDAVLGRDTSSGVDRKILVVRFWNYIFNKLVALTDVHSFAWVLAEDDMSSNDPNKVATQRSIKNYVDNSVSSSGVKNKFDATTNPTVNNDSSENYAVGSHWINTSDDTIFICTDNTAGAAVWIDVTETGAGTAWDGDITDIDIVGGTDIGAALEDGDLFIVNDGVSANVKRSTLLRLWNYIQPKISSGSGSGGDTLEEIMYVGTTLDIDLSAGNIFDFYWDGDINAMTISNMPASTATLAFQLLIHRDGTDPAYNFTWNANINWPYNSAPSPCTSSSMATDIFEFRTIDGGSSWLGRLVSEGYLI